MHWPLWLRLAAIPALVITLISFLDGVRLIDLSDATSKLFNWGFALVLLAGAILVPRYAMMPKSGHEDDIHG